MKRLISSVARVALTFFLVVAGVPALAEGVVVEKSDIRFVANQLGVNVEGRFRRFRANVVFRPAALQASRADIEVDLASVDLASEDSEREVRGAMWFDANHFPVAKFTSTSFRDLGGGKFQVAGKFSLKGVTRDVTIPFTLTRDAAGNRIVESTFGVKRLDFKVGQGEWGDPDTVADNVVVRVRMVLTPDG
ncbi:MAG TPA: YceI family protein [Casimicrobiaceae bacterium]|nr:YceI family protein [Casimicrobiaceae bacterium]